MKMMIDRLPFCRMLFLLTIFLVGSGQPAWSQVRAPGVVSGRIVEKGSGVPVEYANVMLIDTLTMKMLTGAVTDSTGRFTISDVRNGVFYMEYTFIGYQKTRTGPVTISRKNQKQDLGVLELAPAAVNMEEVTITAERTPMITRIDRKVFNVQKDILAQSGTVTDMLQNIPSVSVDIDGNISLRGSGVTILINGRPSVLAGSANLEQMPASLVERIEVITNPSAKYRPDGTGGIINIILKKEQKAGLNGTLGVNGGANSRFNTNLQLNYNTGKFNLFGSYGYRQDYRYSTRTLNSQTIDTATVQSTYLEQSSEGFAWPASHLATAGFDWFPTKKDATGLSANFNYRDVSRHDSTWNRYLDSAKTVTEEFNRIHGGVEKETSLGLTGYYEHVFNREDEHSLRADIEYQRDRENEDDHYEDHYLTPEYPPLKDHTTAVNTSQETDLNLEYSRPLWEGASLEGGYAGYVQVEDINQDVEAWDDSLGNWVADSAARNRFHGVQWVHALYATLSWEWKNFSVMAGLRAEEALLNLDFISIDTSARNDYFDLYPTLHLGYRFGKNEFQLNYSKRVNRPDVDDMNPVPEYRDPRNIFVGNPDLRPEVIHSFELGYSYQVKALTLVPTLFYRYKVNGFSMVTRSINDSTLVTTIENLDTDQSAGLDFSGTWQIGKIASINFSASGFYNQIDASSLGYEGMRSALSGTLKVNASVNLTKTTIFQINGQYRSKALTAQGYRLPTWVVNLGFRQDLWKKKLSVIATVSDLFNTQAFKSTVDTPILVQESVRKRDYRVIYAGLLLNFGTNGKKTKEPKFEFDNQMEGR
ncbi:MAG: TonB-dependent receptor [Bacteroidales bacterium]|nr:TonB-dependent receptor [Bacteroidales bacterium]